MIYFCFFFSQQKSDRDYNSSRVGEGIHGYNNEEKDDNYDDIQMIDENNDTGINKYNEEGRHSNSYDHVCFSVWYLSYTLQHMWWCGCTHGYRNLPFHQINR